MEPKPTFTWKDYGRSRFYLSLDDGRYSSYGIVIYRPYGSDTFPWTVVGDYESDYPDMIHSSHDIQEVKTAAENYWFECYLNG